MEELIKEYWPLICAFAPFAFKVLNRYTPKWYTYSDYFRRGALMLIDLLDMYTVESKPGKGVADA